MNRREALQLLAGGMAIPLVPRNLLAFREARSILATEPAFRTLNAHQQAIVRTIAEMIIPKTDTPGATDVGASEFIDLMLTEWLDDSAREKFLAGLNDVDRRTQTLFGKSFTDAAAAQQATFLTLLGEEMMDESARLAERGRAGRGAAPRSDGFYPTLRRLTLIAYYTSEAGASAELNFEMIPSRHDECAPATANAPESK